MTDAPARTAPSRFNANFIWKLVFVAGILALGFGFYLATEQAHYIWRWNRLPRYFYYTETVEVRSELDGVVASVARQGDEALVVVEGKAGSAYYEVPGADLRVVKGESVTVGEVIGVYDEGRRGLLLDGLMVTVQVSVVAIVLGIGLGLFTGLARLSGNPALRWSAITYIEIIRGSPLLVQIMIWYFVIGTLINNLLVAHALPRIPELWFGVLSLAIFAGAYVAEIVRAGIQSIDRGQMEAARSLGMTKATAMGKIILPQAVKRILPPLAGQFISLIKDSSLLGIIAIRELTKATREAVTSSLMPYELWFLCGVMYLVITFSLSMFVQYLEKRTGE